MRELLRTNDPVLLSRVLALLAEDGIEAVVFDTHTSVLEGSINAIPQRLMVDAADFWRARLVLAAVGERASGE